MDRKELCNGEMETAANERGKDVTFRFFNQEIVELETGPAERREEKRSHAEHLLGHSSCFK